MNYLIGFNGFCAVEDIARIFGNNGFRDPRIASVPTVPVYARPCPGVCAHHARSPLGARVGAGIGMQQPASIQHRRRCKVRFSGVAIWETNSRSSVPAGFNHDCARLCPRAWTNRNNAPAVGGPS